MNLLLVLMIGITIALCFWFWKGAIRQLRERSALRQSGAEVQGEITTLQRRGRSQDELRYTFTVNGKIVSGEAEVPARLMQSLRNSNYLTIRYLPSNPVINYPVAWERSHFELWSAFLDPMFFVPICVMASTGLSRRRKLVVWGKPVVGVVTRCDPSNPTFAVKYEFRTDTGTIVKGRGLTPILQEVGATIWILYLPQNPRQNHPYPVPDYIVEK